MLIDILALDMGQISILFWLLKSLRFQWLGMSETAAT